MLEKAGKEVSGWLRSPITSLLLVVVWGIISIAEFRKGDYELMTITLLVAFVEGCIFYSRSSRGPTN